MKERELKLVLPGPFVMPPLKIHGEPVDVVSLPTQELRATYYDTQDLRLARRDVTLRMRTGEAGVPPWTLKLPVGADLPGELTREEIRLDGARRDPPSETVRLLTAVTRSAPLRAVATIRTRRRRWSVRSGDAEIATVADDEVSVLEGRRVVARFHELEVEAEREDAPLTELAAQLRAAGAVDAEPIPKVVRALGSGATAAPDGAGPTAVVTMADALASAIADGIRRIIEADPAARLGAEEGVHQMRVAFRRLRSDLRTLTGIVDPEWAAAISERIGAIAAPIGKARELDVLVAALSTDRTDSRTGLDGMRRNLRRRRGASFAALMAMLDAPSYVELLDELVHATEQPPATYRGERPIASELPTLVLGAWQRLARRTRSLNASSPPEAFHAARVAAKRTRYAAELAGRLLPGAQGRGAVQFAKRLADAQGVLGTIQDAAVAHDHLQAWVQSNGVKAVAAFEAGKLAEQLHGEAIAAREAFLSNWPSLSKKRWRRWAEG